MSAPVLVSKLLTNSDQFKSNTAHNRDLAETLRRAVAKAVVTANRVAIVMAKAVATARRSKESCHVATQANQIPQAVQGP